jgi:hypothetical protein
MFSETATGIGPDYGADTAVRVCRLAVWSIEGSAIENFNAIL